MEGIFIDFSFRLSSGQLDRTNLHSDEDTEVITTDRVLCHKKSA